MGHAFETTEHHKHSLTFQSSPLTCPRKIFSGITVTTLMMSLSGNMVRRIFTESVEEETEGLAGLLYIHF